MAYDKLLILDLETTGLDPQIHEIIDIGAILCAADSMEIYWEHEAKLKPSRIEVAQPKALEVNGYNEQDWEQAFSFEQGFTEFIGLLDETMVLTGQNVWFDVQFYLEGLKKVGRKNLDPLDTTPYGYSYHRLDIASMAFPFLSGKPKLSMSKISPLFGITPEPSIHRAINGARNAYNLLKSIRYYGSRAQLPQS